MQKSAGNGLLVCLATLISLAVFNSKECWGAIYAFQADAVDGSSNIGGQFQMEVVDAGFNDAFNPARQMVDFTFRNLIGVNSNVAEIYFQDGPLIGAGFVLNQNAGTSFQISTVKPKDLPGGDSLSPDFKVTAGFKADIDIGKNTNGLDQNADSVTFRFTLINGHTYAEVLEALEEGFLHPEDVWNPDGSDKLDAQGNPLNLGLRIGMHVRSIGPTGQSASFISGERIDTSEVVITPEPASMTIWGLGLCVAVVITNFRLRRPKST